MVPERLERQRGGGASVRQAGCGSPLSGRAGRIPGQRRGSARRRGRTAVKRGLLLVLLLPSVALGWEEEAAIAFILAYHPVVTAQRAVAVAYQPLSLGRRVMEHTELYIFAGMLAAVVIAVRVFLFRGAGRAN